MVVASASDAKKPMPPHVAIHHIRILLDDVGERLGIDQRHGKLLVERVVVPIHFREPEDSGTGLMPAARTAETTDQDRRWRRLERAFLVDVGL